jgi:hypothetical protein
MQYRLDQLELEEVEGSVGVRDQVDPRIKERTTNASQHLARNDKLLR